MKNSYNFKKNETNYKSYKKNRFKPAQKIIAPHFLGGSAPVTSPFTNRIIALLPSVLTSLAS